MKCLIIIIRIINAPFSANPQTLILITINGINMKTTIENIRGGFLAQSLRRVVHGIEANKSASGADQKNGTIWCYGRRFFNNSIDKTACGDRGLCVRIVVAKKSVFFQEVLVESAIVGAYPKPLTAI